MFRVDILMLQEPGLSRGDPIQHQAWAAFHGADPGQKPRAVTYFKLALIAKLPLELDPHTTNQCTALLFGDIAVTNIYNCLADNPTPLTRLQANVDRIRNSPRQYLIAGDFNLHHPNWQAGARADAASHAWVEWAIDHELDLISAPGKPTHNRGNVIDLVYAQDTLPVELTHGPQEFASDHLAHRFTIRPRTRFPTAFANPPARHNYK